jgi:hypothetical protein
MNEREEKKEKGKSEGRNVQKRSKRERGNCR